MMEITKEQKETMERLDIPVTTYMFDWFGNKAPKRGDMVKRLGYVGEGRLVAANGRRDDGSYDVVVIAWKGYGENPGSRYSMLYDYYPANTEVFTFSHVDPHGRVCYKSLIEWQTRVKKIK